MDDSRNHPSARIPVGLPLSGYHSLRHNERLRPGALRGCELSIVFARFGPVPSNRGTASPVRLSPPGNTSFLLPSAQLYRVLAADQHLLEGLHDEGGLLPCLLPASEIGCAQGCRDRRTHHCDVAGVRRDLVPPRLSVVLDPRNVPAFVDGRGVLGHPRGASRREYACGAAAWTSAHATRAEVERANAHQTHRVNGRDVRRDRYALGTLDERNVRRLPRAVAERRRHARQRRSKPVGDRSRRSADGFPCLHLRVPQAGQHRWRTRCP